MDELDLLVVGDLNPDLILAGGDVHPRFNQVENIVESADLVIGGSASITAVGASRLGLKTGLCAVVGDDRRGDTVTAMVAQEGVDISAVRQHPSLPTGITVVLVDQRDRAMLTAPGGITELGPTDLAALPDRPARHVHVSSYYLMSAAFRQSLEEHLQRFRDAGATVSVDTNWDPTEEWSISGLLELVDFFFPNESELLELTDHGSVETALPSLSGFHATVIVKTGSTGAALMVDDAVARVPAPDIIGFTDSIGAGDSFNAGYIAAYLAGLRSTDAVAVAVAVGSLSTRGRGGTARQPSHDEAWQLAGLPQ